MGRWKGKFPLFQVPATGVVLGGGESTDICPKAGSPTLTSRELRAFIDRVGGGLHAETAQSSLTVIFELVISGLTSIILMVLVTVNLQFGVD